jgi:hypothetical protein
LWIILYEIEGFYIINTALGTICESGVIDLNLRKPKAVQRKSTSIKKKKRDNGEAVEEVEVNARVRMRSEHFKNFVNGVMDTLDSHEMTIKLLVLKH